MKRYCIYWTCSREARLRICKRFRISVYLTINGETLANIHPSDIPLFLETAHRGFFKLRNKKV